MVRLKKRTKKRIIQVIAILLTLMMLLPLIAYLIPNSSASDIKQQLNKVTGTTNEEETNNPEPVKIIPEAWKGPYEVIGVDTGDRIHIAYNEKEFEYIDLIGIDAPAFWEAENEEEKEAGEAAYSNARSLIEGNQIYLVYDEEDITEEKIEALVYLEDGTNLNLQMLKDGFAKASSPLPEEVEEAFLNAQKKAEDEEAGLWADFWKEKTEP